MMDPPAWSRRKEIFWAAAQLPADRQPAYIEQESGGDEELQRDVRDMLSAHSGPESASGESLNWDSPLWHNAGRAPDSRPGEPDIPVDDFVRGYRILRLIGHGGAGSVYLAERSDDLYRRKAAIKVIRSQSMGSEIAVRFQQERQILGVMDHPNIARILDAGTTAAGWPYLVMDFVEGIPIDQYCRLHALPVRARVQLMLAACAPVQHVHQKLVVHRDLKPSNILVTSEGVPKLLDFGIAKLVGDEGPVGASATTRTWMRLMTPEYASPEQFRGEAITVATDIYSLGSILYVLLAGREAFPIASMNWREASRAVCELEPAPPSTAAEGRTKDEVAGDLDNIVLKALEKEPSRRYASVESLSEDLRRYLEGKPVRAREATPGYRAAKFVRRHWFVLAAAKVALLLLAIGITATMWEARVARREKAEAERRFDDVRSLARSVLLEAPQMIQDLPRATAARRVLAGRGLAYLDHLAGEKPDNVALQLELAEAYREVGDVHGNPSEANLGEPVQAVENYRQALKIVEAVARREPKNGAVRLELAEIYQRLGDVWGDPNGLWDPENANASLSKALELLQQSPPGAQRNKSELAVLRRIGEVLLHQKAPSESVPIFERLLREAQVGPGDPARLAQAWQQLGSAYLALGSRGREAGEAVRNAMAIWDQQRRQNPADVTAAYGYAQSLFITGKALAASGQRETSHKRFLEAQRVLESLVRADPEDARARMLFAKTETRLARFEAATGRSERQANTLRARAYDLLRERTPAYRAASSGDGRCPALAPSATGSNSATALLAGKILVANYAPSQKSSVLAIDRTTGTQDVISEGGYLVEPVGLAVTSGADILVADAKAFDRGGLVRLHYDPGSGKWIQSVAACGGYLHRVNGLALLPDGSVLVADGEKNMFGGSIIHVEPSTGRQSVVAEGGFLAQMDALVPLRDGSTLAPNFWSVDGGPAEIVRILPNGKQEIVTRFGRLEDPVAMVAEPEGSYLIAEQNADGPRSPGAIFRFHPHSRRMDLLTRGEYLTQPHGLEWDGGRYLYLVDDGLPNQPPRVIRVERATGRQKVISEGGLLSEPMGLWLASAN